VSTSCLRPAPLALALLVAACEPPAPHPAGPPAPPRLDGRLDLVESAPIETTLLHADLPEAYEVWPAMIRSAERTLDIAQFYVSNAPGSRLAVARMQRRHPRQTRHAQNTEEHPGPSPAPAAQRRPDACSSSI
jgi:hypothetical protein